MAHGSYYQICLTEAGLWDVRQEKAALANPGSSIREVCCGWQAGLPRTVVQVVQVVHCPNLDLYINYDGLPADGSKVSCAFS